jgi:hypothetical protein
MNEKVVARRDVGCERLMGVPAQYGAIIGLASLGRKILKQRGHHPRRELFEQAHWSWYVPVAEIHQRKVLGAESPFRHDFDEAAVAHEVGLHHRREVTIDFRGRSANNRWRQCTLSEFSIQTGSSARKRRFWFVSRDGKGAEIGTASSVLLATELADEGVEGWREQKAEAGHAQHPEQHGCA